MSLDETKLKYPFSIRTALLRRIVPVLIGSRAIHILDSVWSDRDVSDRVVDNHILSLRKKLISFDHEIFSVYGAGYSLKSKSS